LTATANGWKTQPKVAVAVRIPFNEGDVAQRQGECPAPRAPPAPKYRMDIVGQVPLILSYNLSNKLRKLKYVSAYERRSVNSQVIQPVLRFIADYEKEHEKIPVEDLEVYKK